ncbi:hypothetical protein [Bryobacter aggregatus]|uniref:hypothetical protein n=1 Tax=Bryobacter aggregatus TaxID=360054 RepID=UPI0004E13760|nr:hypothetical protein [Bryobacter aggregatus]
MDSDLDWGSDCAGRSLDRGTDNTGGSFLRNRKANSLNSQIVLQRGNIHASRRVPDYIRSKNKARTLHMVALGSIVECRAEEKIEEVYLDCSIESSSVAPQ